MYSKGRVELRDKLTQKRLKTIWLNEEVKPVDNSARPAALC